MSYSIISILALILNLIINRDTLIRPKGWSDKFKTRKEFITRYRHFLMVSNLYFIVDIGWGLLYQYNDIDAVFPVLYTDCVLYFILMLMTILTWMRSFIAYLDTTDRWSKILLSLVWTMFTLGLIYLIINRFHPFIFSFNDKHEYVPEAGRPIAFIFQITLYIVTAVYMFYLAHKSTDIEKPKYTAVGLTCFAMDLFLILQVLDPMHPSYAAGLIIGICLIHSFVEAGERKEKEIYDNIASCLAEVYEVMYYIDIETGEFREFS